MNKKELINLHKFVLEDLDYNEVSKINVSEIDDIQQVIEYFNALNIYDAYLSNDTDYVIIRYAEQVM